MFGSSVGKWAVYLMTIGLANVAFYGFDLFSSVEVAAAEATGQTGVIPLMIAGFSPTLIAFGITFFIVRSIRGKVY